MDKPTTDILNYQRFLRACGNYQGSLDGDWGPISQKALNDYNLNVQIIKAQVGAVDERSEGQIATLLPSTQRRCRLFLLEANKRLREGNVGMLIKNIFGFRTYREQDEIYAQGRTKPGPIVTNAPGGSSFHNFGLAWDIGLFNTRGDYIPESPIYTQLAELTKKLGNVSGISWGDEPHSQIVPNDSLASIRRAFESGTPFSVA